jgi:MSHA biogenesis protein MshN
MSLINDMLRDLSIKQSEDNRIEATIMELPAAAWEQEKIARFFQHSRLPLILISLFTFLVVFSILNFSTRVVDTRPVVSFEKPKEVFVSQEKVTAGFNDQKMIHQNTISSDISASNKENVLQKQLKVYELIDKASRAMTLDRLTSPESDNAYLYYSELLVLDAANPVALDGLKKITDRYLQMADQALKKNHLQRANEYLEKARIVSPNEPRLAQIVNADAESLQTATLEKPQQQARESDVLGTSTTELPATITTTIKTVDSVSVSDPFEQKLLHDQPRLSVTASNEDLQRLAISEANELIRQGSKTRALENLHNFIQMNLAPEAEVFLLDIYYQDKNLSALEQLLASQLNVTNVVRAYYSARLELLKGNQTSAIHYLESQLSAAAANENYRALLAGLYQREGHDLQAISAYRNLLQTFPAKPAYWLGLALSLDANSQTHAATHAYTQLLKMDNLDMQVRDYAQDRIAELSR